MGRFVEGADRSQLTLLPECLEDWVSEDNAVHVIDAFVEALDLHGMWFERVVAKETVDKHVDRSHRVILGHIVVERCWKQCALPAIQSFNKALHQMPRKIAGKLIARITANRAFSHSLGPFPTNPAADQTSAAKG